MFYTSKSECYGRGSQQLSLTHSMKGLAHYLKAIPGTSQPFLMPHTRQQLLDKQGGKKNRCQRVHFIRRLTSGLQLEDC